ncbi:peptidoglycan-associated lipoprotein [Luminiphilus syltensis NOR5-1B]|uniref:Peptidoglycan-associated lipoprotein n=1 Tax=Luminiphilus syltensis NOR5-1B TaxID=565045 RepID=B8KS59_9GAMM|nr:OmpA family protein [Luminiphilus syltensis]EED36637.1 peptidoglycan-associated lipoprotein [Luminiphilus syltensis NOR5-1B]
MKAVSNAGKLVAVSFASLILAACSGTDSKEQEAAAAAEAAAAEAAAQQAAAEAEAQAARAAAMAEQDRLKDAAMAAGSVFYFAFDSSELNDASRMAIDAHIALLLVSDESIRLEGHTDERGTREYNLALGERRANAVRDYMVANGVPSYRIETISYGEENPIAFGSGEANWSENRRVELK